jgi:pimeloyl-ACP methyl ester carboxylesterase
MIFPLGWGCSWVTKSRLRAESPNDPSTALIGVQILAFLWGVAVAPLALLLLVVAESGRGRLYAVTALLTALLPLATSIAWRKRTRRWAAGVVGGSVLWLGLTVLVLVLAPTGQSKPQARVRHVFAAKDHSFPRYSMGNLLPECDQLVLGFSLMPMVDPLLTMTQAAELKSLTATIYRELENDADFHALGSAMSEPYRELLGLSWPGGNTEPEFSASGSAHVQPGRRFRSGHAYVYVPASLDKAQPKPVVVFFHGSGGNFKGYLWILSKLADQVGFVLVSPSNGLGNWTPQDSGQAVADALAAASRVASVDRGQVHIMGLSNGGLAVSQLAAMQGAPFASITLLSPVFASSEIRSGSFADQNRGRRILVVTGGRDDRIPLDYVEENVSRMKRAGAQITLHTFDDANHFLVFSHRDQLLPILEEWFRRER